MESRSVGIFMTNMEIGKWLSEAVDPIISYDFFLPISCHNMLHDFFFLLSDKN